MAKKSYQQFPIVTIQRILHLLIIIALVAVVTWLVLLFVHIPQLESTQHRLVAVACLAVPFVVWGVVVGIPYALYIRKTGEARPDIFAGQGTPITNMYSKEILKYNIKVNPRSKWILYEIGLTIPWFVATILLVAVIVANFAGN